ncbi:MAG: transposase [Puniceicoccales bacterium]
MWNQMPPSTESVTVCAARFDAGASLAYGSGCLSVRVLRASLTTSPRCRPHQGSPGCHSAPDEPEQQRFGKAKGGRNTKLSLLVNLVGLPLSMKLVCGNEHDSKSAIDTLSGFVEGHFVLADKAYDTNAIRQYIEACGGLLLSQTCPSASSHSSTINKSESLGA